MPTTSLNSDGQPGNSPNDRLSYILSHLIHALSFASCPASSFSTPSTTTFPSSAHAHLQKAKALAQEAKEIVDGYDGYLSRFSSPHPRIVSVMVEESNKRDWGKMYEEGKTKFKLIPEMSAGEYEAVVLQQLAKLSKAKTVLEVGMFTGTTTISLALLPTVTKVVTLELEPYLAQLNEPYFEQANVADKIDIRIGDARASLETLKEEGMQFDMIFIDADKPSYISYFNAIISSFPSSPSLLAKGGFIVADNTTYKASPWAAHDSYAMANDIHKFNETVRNHPGVEVVILPIEDGISLIRRRGE